MKRPGSYVKYTDKAGKVQRGIAYNDEQSPEFKNVNRVFIRLIDDNFQPKLDENGKKIIALKFSSEITVCGFVD